MNLNRPRLNEGQLEVVKKMKGKGISKSYLMLGCPHIPHQNKKIFQGIYNLMDTYTFDGIVIGGDFLDMGSLSFYDKGKVNRLGITLEDEYFAGNMVLDELEKRLPKDVDKVFMYGNHENRYYRWLADVDNAKYGDLIDPAKALRLLKRGWTVYNNYKRDQHKIGSLHIAHGDFYNIHVAKKTLDTWKRNMLFWHTHRIQVHREGNFCAYNCGFLGDVDSKAFDYAPLSMKLKWANGFAIVHIIGNRHYVELINCVDNGFVYAGVKY